MIKRLYDLPIRQKFAVIILPLIVIILVFDILQIRDHYLDYDDSTRLSKAIKVGIEIGHVVHEIQKERSISSGFLANEGDAFYEELEIQRKRTDSTLNQYTEEIGSESFKELDHLHGEDIAYLGTWFSKLVKLRDQIDAHDISSEASIKSFSDINNTALNTVIRLIDETRDKDIAQQVHAIIYFLKAKENASIERAIGTQAFSHSHLDFEMYNQFTTLVANQNSYFEAFRIIADTEFNAYHNKLLSGESIEEVNRMRIVLFKNDSLSEDANHWYEVSTDRINLLKKVEDYMSETIQAKTDLVATESVRKFWSFLLVDVLIGIVTFWLMTTIATNILKNVKILDDFTRKLSSGDLSKKVVIDSKDELGQYAKTFNQMVYEIRKSHFELRKQRDKAKFLYENIYRVSTAVFENIQQGIFLLDKDFKISKFHSNAMKSIFGVDRIAGENFANFMRPLILPRELEALEMFMRHLFNDDMDEEVVNQLNPIDQVKIHTEQDGIVATKYIRVEFTRVYRKEAIHHIMVTVSDETESILLQQHLDEAEKKKQQETERVLSILKIDPSILRGFLHNSRKMLKSISKRYESNDAEDFAQLLNFTMDIIHNLKGNAVVIGMDLMSNKFHEIEETISKLRDRELRGKDFLAVLYEIDEADRMIADISDMLYKIVSIYKKFPTEGHSVSNIMVVDALERGADLISKEEGKNVELNFKNEDNISIPDMYIDGFKDIMIQLVRNSIVHGIEAPSARITAGKVTTGELMIELKKADDTLIVNYRDDGAGLDIEEISVKALEKGLITEFELAKKTEAEIAELIFSPGFSTKDKSSKHAGRGQGMHLVKSIVEEHGGSFKISYEKGKYFGLTLQLPYVEEIPEQE